jgi:hypothetical protein
MNPAYSIPRADPSWHPSFAMRPVLYLVPRGGAHRNSPDWRPRLGQSDQTQQQRDAQIVGGATTAAGGILAAFNASTKSGEAQGAAVAAAGIITATCPICAPFVPIGLALATLIIGEFSGCGQSCTLTSQAADKIEKLLQQNKDAYFAIPDGQRTKSVQAVALANFDNTWAKLVQYCGNPSFGSAGQRCVTDRQRGACRIKTPDGQCWDWFKGYYDPIANDASVVPDSVPAVTSQVKSALDQIFGGTNGAPLNVKPLLLIGGAVLLWMVLS